MKNSRKSWIIFRRIILILFVFYLINYFQVESGNYISGTTQKTILTQEKIKEFEKDVKEGKFVDIKDYTENNTIDSTNSVSNIGYTIGEGVSEFVSIKIIDFFNFVGKFIS